MKLLFSYYNYSHNCNTLPKCAFPLKFIHNHIKSKSSLHGIYHAMYATYIPTLPDYEQFRAVSESVKRKTELLL